MNIVFKSIVIAVLLLTMNACRQRVGNDSFKVIKDGDGNLQSEIHYINDTVMHGLAKYYYYPNPKNVLKDEIEFNHGIKEGWYKHYRKDGTMESKTFFKNNLPDGENYWYYEDGKPKEETFWIKGKQYGSGKWYYKSGKLETFNMTDFYDNVFYVIQNDEQGNKVKEDGVVFSTKFIAMYATDSSQTPIVEDAIKAGKEVIIRVTIAQPPQTKTTIRMGELKKGKMIELPIENYTATYKQTYTEAGKHTLVTVGEIKDLQGNLVKHDSTTVIMNVIE